MIPRCARALLSLTVLGLLAACGGTAATNTPAAVATTAPASATTASAPSVAASPATSAAPRASTPASTPATPAATPATPRATPTTPTRAASPAAATPATPLRPASPSAGGGTVMTDADNQCQVTLPTTFTPDPAGGGNAVSADERVGVNVLAFPVDTFGFDGTIDFIIGTVSASVEGYQETGRQSGTSRGRQYTDVTYQGTSVGEPVAGRFHFVQEGANVCALTVVMQAAAACEYATTIDALAESVQAVRP